MVSLPWSRESQDNKDIRVARDQLDHDHYGLETVKERILEYLVLMKLILIDFPLYLKRPVRDGWGKYLVMMIIYLVMVE